MLLDFILPTLATQTGIDIFRIGKFRELLAFWKEKVSALPGATNYMEEGRDHEMQLRTTTMVPMDSMDYPIFEARETEKQQVQ